MPIIERNLNVSVTVGKKRGGRRDDTLSTKGEGRELKKDFSRSVARTAATDGACKARPAAGQKLIIDRGEKTTRKPESKHAGVRLAIRSGRILMLLGQLSLIPEEPLPTRPRMRCTLPG